MSDVTKPGIVIDVHFLSVDARQEELFQAVLALLTTTSQHYVECVEEGVGGGIEGQHKDGSGHPDLTGCGDPIPRQQFQHTDREPAETVGHRHSQKATSKDHDHCGLYP